VIFVDIFVSVPINARRTEGATGEELYEADTAFEETASEEAAAGEVRCFFAVKPIACLGLLSFLSEVSDVRHGELHFGSELVCLHASAEMIFVRGFFECSVVHSFEEFAGVLFKFSGSWAGGEEVADSRAG
jgi:hypothetical protein